MGTLRTEGRLDHNLRPKLDVGGVLADLVDLRSATVAATELGSTVDETIPAPADQAGSGPAGRHARPSNTVGGLSTSLFTIGYEGRSIAEVLDALASADVQRLVDVRELPLSRRRGFSKTALGEALDEIGVEYVHVRPLGNPKKNRERYWAGDVAGGADVYRRHLHNGSYSALTELAESLHGEVTCLLCFERDHAVCHRDVIVESLIQLRPDIQVSHL